MNNELLKRIDEWLSCGTFDTDDLDAAEHLLIKCRAEIERLTTELAVTDENHGRTTLLAHKALKDLDKANAKIERLSKPYVPVTGDEAFEVTKKLMDDGHGFVSGDCICAIEATVIKRAGLEVKHD